jgi:N-acetylglucosaminyl-diphospho-decaprenol L-rhamnosyltransferase
MTRPEVAVVVITHGPHEDLPACLAAAAEQADELVVVANLPGPVEGLPDGATVIEQPRPLGYAANANAGVRATAAPFVAIANPDAIARPGALAVLLDFAKAHPRSGVIGPAMVYADGSWQPSRRSFPTVLGTLVRRTPLRLVFDPKKWQRRHYLLDDVPDEPVQADWLLGGFLLLRREMLDDLGGMDAGFRLYGEDIDLGYRAAKAGWERWLVPQAVVQHRYGAVIDQTFLSRRTWWHFRGMLRFVRKHPASLLGR